MAGECVSGSSTRMTLCVGDCTGVLAVTKLHQSITRGVVFRYLWLYLRLNITGVLRIIAESMMKSSKIMVIHELFTDCCGSH